MAGIIATYDYTYGSGDQANRRICFSRPGNASTIQARISVLRNGVIQSPVSNLGGGRIKVEMESTSDKVSAIALSRNLLQPELLANLDSDQQNDVLGDLQPNGRRKIDIELGMPPETVRSLRIYDPS